MNQERREDAKRVPPDELKHTVARAYARALDASQTRAHGSAVLAGYGAELDAFGEAGASSFGCGNPLAFADVQLGQTLLDLGSGAGLDLLIAAERVGDGGKVVGVDMTEEMVAAARRHAAQVGRSNIDVRHGEIEALPVEDGSVDWVISNCVVNLSADKTAVFQEIVRVLKPGGRISIADLVVEELPDWIRAYTSAHVACLSGALSEAEFKRGLTDAGLAEVSVLERQHYSAEQLRALVSADLESLGVEPELLQQGLNAVEGKVWSARFIGRRL